MRITDSLQYNILSQNIETSLENLNTVQQQVSSGKKLTTFSDDPAGATEALTLNSALADNAQYQRNATQATAVLTATDSALASANTLIQSARQIALQGANSSQTTDSYTALGGQVDGIIQQLTQVANTQLGGRYLFGGTNTKTPPYDANQNYQGNTQALTTTVGPNYTLQINTPGSTALGPAFTALQTLKKDLTAAAAGTSSAVNSLSNDIGVLDSALAANSAAQAGIGAKSDQVSAVSQQLTRTQTQYQNNISNIEDVDLAQAYVQLQSAQNVYQASLSTTAKAYQYSLADYIH